MSAEDTEQPAPPAAAQGDDYRPRLRHAAFRFTSPDAPIQMIVGKEYFEIAEVLGTREEFFEVKRYLDGRHTLTQIAERSGVDEDSVRQVVAAFSEIGLLHRAEPFVTIPAKEFAAQVEASCEMWGRQVGYHRLFSGLDKGEYRAEVFLGLVLETYHYVRSAPKHIATAIAHCDDERLVPLLSKYFTEEWNHAGMMRLALKRMGMPKSHIETANPTIGTWSLVNNLCEIARQDTLSYLACTSLFEARADDFDAAAESLRRAARLVGFAEDCAEPLITHMRVDLEAGHVGLLEESVEVLGDIPEAHVHRAVNNLHNLKHSYDQFHDHVVQYYTDIANHLPRLKVDYFSL